MVATLLAVPSSATAESVGNPVVVTSFAGPVDPSSGPPDATSAASPSRVVELVNSRYAIVDRTGVGTTGPIGDLVGASDRFLSDPQIAWDPASARFYFSIFENRGTSGPDEGIAWGFSTTDAPSTAADWCKYFSPFNYGSTAFPDRPSLGITADFVTFVSERFTVPAETFDGVDVAWVSKPSKGKHCPKLGRFMSGLTSLKDTSGNSLSYGVAARQVDNQSTGWVIGQLLAGDSLQLYSITKDPRTKAAIIGPPTTLPVPAYSFPPTAPQAGTTNSGAPAPMLETKGYLTQAYAAFDPRVGHMAIWTAHGVAGGAGAAVRWYEINPAAATLDQVGTVSDANLYVFNGTIAPDRLVNGATSAYGSNMVMTVNTSSAATDAAIQLVSQHGAGPQSPLLLVQSSPGPNIDFDCFQATRSACRWGDYSGASPDPGSDTHAASGQVWVTNQWNAAATDESASDWRTATFLVTP